MGKILCKGDLHINYFNLNVARGYYLIHIQTNGNFITKKIFIQ